MPIHRNSLSLDHAIGGALHNDFCLFNFCLPSVAEPAANSCFHVRAGKDRSPAQQVEKPEVSRALYIRIQFELAEVPRLFLLRPGNETSHTEVIHFSSERHTT